MVPLLEHFFGFNFHFRKVWSYNGECRWCWGRIEINKLSMHCIKCPFWPQNLIFGTTVSMSSLKFLWSHNCIFLKHWQSIFMHLGICLKRGKKVLSALRRHTQINKLQVTKAISITMIKELKTKVIRHAVPNFYFWTPAPVGMIEILTRCRDSWGKKLR